MNLLNRRFEVVTIDIITLLYLGVSRTIGILLAAMAFSLLIVLGALIGYKVTMLSKQTVEHGPSAFATFSKIVALHQELR